MERINGYETARAYADVEKLPVGGYIIQILDANELTYDWGRTLEIKFDIAEGEYKDFYTNQYKESQFENAKYKGTYRLNIPKDDGTKEDEWTLRRFKTNIAAVEESNSGYHWDWNEKGLVGKKVGAIFFDKEWEMNDNSGFYTALHNFKSVEKIKAGKFKIPEPKLLKEKNPLDGFEEVSTDGIPFETI